MHSRRQTGGFITDNIKRKTLCDGVNFTVINDKRFKQNQLSISFLLPLKRETASVNALLPLVLRHGSREYPDLTALNRKLKELYGARIDGATNKRGEMQMITVYCECLGDDYTFGGEQILPECASLLKSIVFDPAFENGVFKSDVVEIEKRNLTDMINSQLNDKRQYATMRLKEEMCKNEAYGVSELGRREDVAKITPQTLLNAWRFMLSNLRAEVFLVGSGEPGNIEQMLTEAFGTLGRTAPADVTTEAVKKPQEARTIVERLPVAQAKLVMGLRAGLAAPENTDAMQLACAILGGTPQSKLFLNVREKMSLCYYCLAYFEKYKGLVFIDSGIEEQNYDKARTEILHQLSDLKEGSFTDDEVRFAKLSLQNTFTQVNDSIDAMTIYYLGQAISGTMRTPEQAAVDIMKVTREDIVKAAGGIELDTVFLLAGTKEGE